jgi:hypothetical protein
MKSFISLLSILENSTQRPQIANDDATSSLPLAVSATSEISGLRDSSDQQRPAPMPPGSRNNAAPARQ